MTLQEIMQRRAELKNDIATRSNEMKIEEIDAITAELDNLDKEERAIQAKVDLDKRMANYVAPITNETPKETGANEMEKRGAVYKARTGVEVDLRASTQTSAKEGILIPSHMSNVVEPFPWNEVSSVVDLVDFLSLPNGNDYTAAFQVTTGEANYTLEPTKTGDSSADKDGVYNKVDTTFDQVTIKRNKITAIDYMTEELQKLPSANYAALVEANIGLSIKKKLAKEIVLGDGQNNHFVGIACKNTANLNSNTYDDREYEINEETLNDILIDFGGEENIESKQVLVMNKKSIKNFSRVRGNDKQKVYNISVTGNTATIDGYRVVFTSHLKPYNEAVAGEIWAVYADFSKYKALDFGGDSVETSREFKFDQGITAIRGRVYAGGGMAGYKSFLRIKKSAASTAASK